MVELREIINHDYGQCSLGEKCICIQPTKRTSPVAFPMWLGELCPNWKPFNVSSYEELAAKVRELYRKTCE